MPKPAHEVEWDVAFSLLARDAPLATELCALLPPDVRSFLYVAQQGEVLGANAVEAYARTFAEHSRFAVVLLRNGWGDTPYTRVESDAIARLALREGAAHVLVIKLDPDARVPAYIDPTRVWLDFAQYGVDGAAAILTERLKAIGFDVRQPTSAERAQRAVARRDFRARQEAFEQGPEASAAVEAAFVALDAALVQKTTELAAHDPALSIRNERRQLGQVDRGMVIVTKRAGLMVRLHKPFAFQAAESYIELSTWDGVPQVPWARYYEERARISEERYTIHLWPGDVVGWRLGVGDHPMFQISDLVERAFELLYAEEERLLGQPRNRWRR